MKLFLGLVILSMTVSGCSSSPAVPNIAANTMRQASKNSVNTNAEIAANSVQDNISANRTPANVKGTGSLNPNEAPGGIDMKNVKSVTPKNSASDNSEVSAAMNKEGVPVETRVFKNHSILLKTEKIFTDVKNPTARVFLRNGKIVEVPTGKDINVSTARAADILKSVGISENTAAKKQE